MTTYIVLLKGINVGGHKKIAMAKLRELLTQEGFLDVQTYIQSGNIILKSKECSALKIEDTIHHLILTHFGFEVSVLAKTKAELKAIFDRCPFIEDKKKKSYFVMLHNTPDAELVKKASEKMYKDEDYIISNNCMYYYSSKGFGQSKFNVNYFERKFNTFATARNYNTLLKLLSL